MDHQVTYTTPSGETKTAKITGRDMEVILETFSLAFPDCTLVNVSDGVRVSDARL